MVLLTLTKVSWSEIAPLFLLETFSRNVKWLLQECPALSYLEGHNSEFRVNKTVEATKTSQRLLMFQVAFLKLLGRPKDAHWTTVLENYNECFGRPPVSVRRQFHKECQHILKVDSQDEFFGCLALPPPADLCAVMRCAVRDSATAGYHKWKFFKMPWTQIVERRSCEHKRLQRGKGSHPQRDFAAQGQWMEQMGFVKASATLSTRPSDAVSNQHSNATHNSSSNATTVPPSKSVTLGRSYYDVLQSLDDGDVADSA